MSAQEDLKNIQEELKKRGVTDVKFLFGKTSEKPASQVAAIATKFLRFVLSGKRTPMKPIGDESL
jgi:hypothetical protein